MLDTNGVFVALDGGVYCLCTDRCVSGHVGKWDLGIC